MKLLAVTPNAAVSPDPRAEPAKDPPLRMDIRVANSVASTPYGQVVHTGEMAVCRFPAMSNRLSCIVAREWALIPFQSLAESSISYSLLSSVLDGYPDWQALAKCP